MLSLNHVCLIGILFLADINKISTVSIVNKNETSLTSATSSPLIATPTKNPSSGTTGIALKHAAILNNTVISESGAITQNRPEIKAKVMDSSSANQSADKIAIQSSNNSSSVLASTFDTAIETNKTGHFRGVYKTGDIPESREQQPMRVPIVPMSIVNNITVSPPLSKINGSSSITVRPPVSLVNNTSTSRANVSSSIEKNMVNGSTTAQSKLSSTTTKPSTAPASASSSSINSTNSEVPKKPEITFSVDDDPHLKSIKDTLSKTAYSTTYEGHIPLSEPIILQSSELLDDDYKGRDYVMPIIGLIFAVPLFLFVANCVTRELKNCWSKRNYQRMDYLINDLYN